MIKVVDKFDTTAKTSEPTLEVMVEDGSHSCKLTFRDEDGNRFTPVLFEVQSSFTEGDYHLRFWIKGETGADHQIFTYRLPKVPSF